MNTTRGQRHLQVLWNVPSRWLMNAVEGQVDSLLIAEA
jgi:hypothetical protein